MDGFIPTGGAGSTALVQGADGSEGLLGSLSATLASTPTPGNTLIAVLAYRGSGTAQTDPTGWTKHADIKGPDFDGGRMILYSKVAGVAESPTLAIAVASTAKSMRLEEWAGLVAFDDVAEDDNRTPAATMTTPALTPGVSTGVLFAGFNESSRVASHVMAAPFAESWDNNVDASGPSVVFGHQIVGTFSGSPYTASCTTNKIKGYGAFLASFEASGGGITWIAAPDTTDADDGTSDDVDAVAIANAGNAFWRGDYGSVATIGTLDAVLGFEDAGAVTVYVQGGDASDWSDAATVVQIDYTATGSFTADELHITWDGSTHRYWRLVLDAPQGVEVFEVGLGEVSEHVPTEPARAILEIYVHDEDASRWGTATWATGPATGTEGIWSGAGWQDVTPQGVNAHIIWGSREPDKGILARQAAASWNVETYDPDRILDPDNADSPYYPQVVAGTPIRISHDTTVIRTGYIDRIGYKYKAPDYRGQLLCTDTISLFNQAVVPEDSILGDTLHDRVWDAIEASGIAVGGIPTGRPSSGPGPDIAPLDTDNPRERSVWDHVLMASQEVLWVAYVNHDASLGLRSWGGALDRGREITAANLEDLESVSHEDGLYSVARIQGSDPDVAPIEREAAPLPRYGRRVYERTELTIDPEGHADAVLQERSWPGVRYSPGTIHCWTAADVDYFGTLQIMERVTVTVPGVVSVEGRILGGELWVQHYRDNERGATWQFNFAVATEGSTAIGLTTLVADGTGETLLDDATETDYLEAD